MYTVEQIKEAFQTLTELVEYQTGRPAQQIAWNPADIKTDLLNILTKEEHIMADIEAMRAPKVTMF
jgi:hypothetical protein